MCVCVCIYVYLYMSVYTLHFCDLCVCNFTYPANAHQAPNLATQITQHNPIISRTQHTIPLHLQLHSASSGNKSPIPSPGNVNMLRQFLYFQYGTEFHLSLTEFPKNGSRRSQTYVVAVGGSKQTKQGNDSCKWRRLATHNEAPHPQTTGRVVQSWPNVIREETGVKTLVLVVQRRLVGVEQGGLCRE